MFLGRSIFKLEKHGKYILADVFTGYFFQLVFLICLNQVLRTILLESGVCVLEDVCL